MLKFRNVNILFASVGLILLALTWIFSISLIILIPLIVIYLLLVAYGTTVLSAQFFVDVRSGGNNSSNAIAITFDDGPVPGKTEKILDILHSHKIPAAFFCIGNRVAANPELAKRIYKAGHLLGNHSYWHRNTFDLQSSKKIEQELRDTNDVIEGCVGVRPAYFRPPYGVTNPMVASAINHGGYKTVGWTVRSFDTISKDPKSLLRRVTKSLKSGDIVLFHDYCDITREILPEFLEKVASSGLKIVRVDQLLNEKAYV